MNNIISQKNKNKRYLPHEIKTRKHAVEMYRNCGDIEYVCRKYHISRTSLWRWNKKYDGTIESIIFNTKRKKSRAREEMCIKNLEKCNKIMHVAKRNVILLYFSKL